MKQCEICDQPGEWVCQCGSIICSNHIEDHRSYCGLNQTSIREYEAVLDQRKEKALYILRITHPTPQNLTIIAKNLNISQILMLEVLESLYDERKLVTTREGKWSLSDDTLDGEIHLQPKQFSETSSQIQKKIKKTQPETRRKVKIIPRDLPSPPKDQPKTKSDSREIRKQRNKAQHRPRIVISKSEINEILKEVIELPSPKAGQKQVLQEIKKKAVKENCKEILQELIFLNEYLLRRPTTTKLQEKWRGDIHTRLRRISHHIKQLFMVLPSSLLQRLVFLKRVTAPGYLRLARYQYASSDRQGEAIPNDKVWINEIKKDNDYLSKTIEVIVIAIRRL